MLLHDVLPYWATRTPDNVMAVVEDGGESLTFAEAERVANKISSALKSLDVKLGDRVGVLGANSLLVPLALYGAAKAGAVTVPLNPRLTGAELRFIIDNAEITVLFVATDFVASIDPIRSELAGVRAFVTLGESAPEGWELLGDWLNLGTGIDPKTVVPEKAAAFQIYTSGTTGRPKGAVISHSTQGNALLRWNLAGMRLGPGDVFYLPMPISLAAGFNSALAMWTQGATVMMASFNPEAVLKALDSVANATSMSPTMIKRCIELPGAADRSYSGFRWILYGAAPMPGNVLSRAMEVLGCDFYQGFGQTEAPPISMLTPEDHRKALDGREDILLTVGRSYMGTEVGLLDEDGVEAAPGKVGEVCVRGDWVMSGYWKDEAGTAALAAGGWHHTRDLAYKDEEGYLHVVDRVDDAVISGGYNIYPREIEMVLEEIPGIAQVAVFGVASEKWGEELIAAIIALPDNELTEQELVALCRPRLAGYKIPRRFVFLSELPMNSNGKILKRTLRETHA